MRKILIVAAIAIFLLSGIEAVALNNDVDNSIEKNLEKNDYTHTVLVEVGTAQWCGPCATWNANIYNTYNSGNYDFEYVEMIYSDHDGNVLNTLANTWINIYNPTYIPASIFDGDFQRLEGNYPAQLPTALNTCGQRSVPDIEASLSVTWLGSATLDIDIAIINHETTQYSGYIRVPIAEIISRYDTATGTDYHHGFLDYAFTMNTPISIAPDATYTNSVTWVGSEHQDTHGNDFGDIQAGNIIVILAVFNNVNGYVDETVASTIQAPPNTPSNPSPQDGQTNVDTTANLAWTGGDPNPSDTVTYDVYFGTTNPPVKVASNQTATSYEPGTLAYETTFYWKIIAWDNYGATAQGPVWDFTTLINPNNEPTKPEIDGPAKGEPGKIYKYTIRSTDVENDHLYCYVNWGDNTSTEWAGPYNSGQAFAITHSWTEKATYTVQVKVKDEHGAESEWATLEVKVPTSYGFSHPFIKWLFEQFPNAFLVLRHLFGA